jgi:hypothetical protein
MTLAIALDPKSISKGVDLGFAVPPDDDRIRATLEEISRREEFNPQGWSSPDFTWLQKFFEWLGTLLDAAPVLFWILLITCIILLVAILAHIIWTVRKVFGGGKGKDGLSRAERRRLSAAYLQAANEAADTRAFTEAVRNLFLALVYRFDESGKLHFEPARTNREYLRHFVKQPQLQEPLQVFVDTLDEHWYGMHELPESAYRDCRQRFDTLWQDA